MGRNDLRLWVGAAFEMAAQWADGMAPRLRRESSLGRGYSDPRNAGRREEVAPNTTFVADYVRALKLGSVISKG
jgi:hypothetical protein